MNDPRNKHDPQVTGDARRGPKLDGGATNIDHHKVSITFFPTGKAYSKRAAKMTLPALRDLIQKANGDKKSELEWLKFGTFGDIKSKKGSLRTNQNMETISGVEGDYDCGEMAFEDAIEIVKKAGVRSLIYTSANHSPLKPRHRTLFPTSRDLPKGERTQLMARANGLFGGAFAPESFVLSQSYYYGSVKNNPAHRAVLIDGRFIDQADDLDATAMGKSGKKVRQKRGVEFHLATLGDGPGLNGFNGPLCSATAAYVAQHGVDFDIDALKAKLVEAIERAPKKSDRDVSRYLRGGDLDTLISTAIEKYGKGVRLDDFVAYMPLHNYIFTPTREPWPANSVNARIPPVALLDGEGTPLLDDEGNEVSLPASVWLDKNQPVEQMTWAPGLPMEIKDRLIADGGWIDRKGVTCFNLYRPPTIIPGNASDVKPWLDHIHKVYPDDAEHFLDWFAQRKQHPDAKINHALVFGGRPGIGKDTLLEPVKRAVGPWNFSEASPQNMIGRFNGFLKSVILRINEARDLGDINRYQFHEHMKAYTAAPPDVLRVDEKNLREHYVLNCTGVIITTNHKTDGIYLPADDRRHYVAWSDLTAADFSEEYWTRLWNWYDRGGDRNVAAYLATRNISLFNPKAPPQKTAAFWAIVDANRAPEESELADILDQLGNPAAVTLDMIRYAAHGNLEEWLNDRKNRRAIPHRLDECGYVPIRNTGRETGVWVVDGTRQVVYSQASLSPRDQLSAVAELVKNPWKKPAFDENQKNDADSGDVKNLSDYRGGRK
jgi:Family of unknown function (DUF5906)